MNKYARIVVTLLPVCAVGLLVLQVVVSNMLAARVSDISSLNRQYSEQKEMHELLVVRVASASSLMAIREKAHSLGFREPLKDQIVNISAPVPVALGSVR